VSFRKVSASTVGTARNCATVIVIQLDRLARSTLDLLKIIGLIAK
jgi:DNA invertase Pin-like site-specific DNA recombinase